MSGPQKVHPKNDTSYEGFHDPSGALELDPEEEALVSTYFKSDKNWARIYCVPNRLQAIHNRHCVQTSRCE
eukprot:m.116028 g.116028  ORF g.116028 m.116028 type:complete len:71 (+) comp13119_c0_seq1:209-421(+)